MTITKTIKAIKPVYSYYFPEVREIIDRVVSEFPHDILLKSVFPGLDDFHLEVIDKYINFYKKEIPAISNFQFKYTSSGSSEGIFHLLVWIKTNHPKTPIYTFKGEYEGYKGYGENIGLKVSEIDLDSTEFEKLKPGFWFISNPSAINGSIIPNNKIISICEAGHRVIYDLAYLGMSKTHRFDLSHPNIIAVVCSMSKPFGLFYYRVGFTFSRFEIKTLYPNVWFKNILSLIIADNILSSFKSDYFYSKYGPLQKKILKKIRKVSGVKILPSDVYLLGYLTKKDYLRLPEKLKSEISKFQRHDFFRFCLTPYFLEQEEK